MMGKVYSRGAIKVLVTTSLYSGFVDACTAWFIALKPNKNATINGILDISPSNRQVVESNAMIATTACTRKEMLLL